VKAHDDAGHEALKAEAMRFVAFCPMSSLKDGANGFVAHGFGQNGIVGIVPLDVQRPSARSMATSDRREYPLYVEILPKWGAVGELGCLLPVLVLKGISKGTQEASRHLGPDATNPVAGASYRD